MAIHLVDKDSMDRTNPSPNVADKLIEGSQGAIGTLSTVYQTPASTGTTRLVFKNNCILSYDAANLISSFYGYIPSVSSTPLFIIAKEGEDVFTDYLGIPRPSGL